MAGAYSGLSGAKQATGAKTAYDMKGTSQPKSVLKAAKDPKQGDIKGAHATNAKKHSKAGLKDRAKKHMSAGGKLGGMVGKIKSFLASKRS